MSVISLKYRSLTLPIVLKNSDSLFESKVGAISDDYFNFEKELWFVSFWNQLARKHFSLPFMFCFDILFK